MAARETHEQRRNATAAVDALEHALAAARRDAVKYRRRWQALRAGLLRLLEVDVDVDVDETDSADSQQNNAVDR